MIIEGSGYSKPEPYILERDKAYLIQFDQNEVTFTLISNREQILVAQRKPDSDLLDSLKALFNG